MKTCIPLAEGVPYLSGPPNWWGPTLTPPELNENLNDPRWNGALSITNGNGTDETVEFRALYATPQKLYLSWNIKFGQGNVVHPDKDGLWVGFHSEVTGEKKVIGFTVGTANLQNKKPQGKESYSVDVYVPDGTGGWQTITPAPPWIYSYARLWIGNYDSLWAIQMVVPSSTNSNVGLNLGSDFKMWYQVNSYAVVNPENPVYHTSPLGIWPRTAADVTGINNFPDAPWGDVTLGAADCATGVTIDLKDIGTTNQDPHEIIVDLVNKQPTSNTFFANPTNNTKNPIKTGEISATFRIANWGSKPDPNKVEDPTKFWDTIPGGFEDVHSQYEIQANGQGPNLPSISKTWTISSSEIDEFLPQGGNPPKKRLHQCILVELSGPLSYPDQFFERKSVVRNMDIAKLKPTQSSRRMVARESTELAQLVPHGSFAREAELSVVGLDNLPSDLYVYVEYVNMPIRPIIMSGEESQGSGRLTHVELKAAMTRWLKGEGDSTEQMFQSLPTVRYHVYYDTGKTLTKGGTTYSILHALTPFGYHVLHDGSPAIWSAGFNMDGEVVTEIAPNYYRLSVPKNGVAVINTTIKAAPIGCLSTLLNWVLSFLPYGIRSAIANLFKSLKG